jgi:PEGA domain
MSSPIQPLFFESGFPRAERPKRNRAAFFNLGSQSILSLRQYQGSDCARSAQNCRRTTLLSDKATLMYRAPSLFYAIFPGFLASAFLLFSGCASHTHTPAARPRLKIQIVSQPAGARIEVNGQYAGDAPLSIDVEASTDGRFWRDTIIKAYPKDTGYTQIKAFNGKSRWTISDMVPPKLFFDTRTDPSAGVQSTQ